jgi:hypothetical protein
MIKQQVELVGIDDLIEEEVKVKVNGIYLDCFAGNCPFALQVGHKYDVVFSYSDFEIEQSEDEECSIEKLNNSYSYKINGSLNNGVINSIVAISDDYLLDSYGYLDGMTVSMIVERLDIEFLK